MHHSKEDMRFMLFAIKDYLGSFYQEGDDTNAAKRTRNHILVPCTF